MLKLPNPTRIQPPIWRRVLKNCITKDFIHDFDCAEDVSQMYANDMLKTSTAIVELNRELRMIGNLAILTSERRECRRREIETQHYRWSICWRYAFDTKDVTAALREPLPAFTGTDVMTKLRGFTERWIGDLRAVRMVTLDKLRHAKMEEQRRYDDRMALYVEAGNALEGQS